jgi:hypothetical protein
MASDAPLPVSVEKLDLRPDIAERRGIDPGVKQVCQQASIKRHEREVS